MPLRIYLLLVSDRYTAISRFTLLFFSPIANIFDLLLIFLYPNNPYLSIKRFIQFFCTRRYKSSISYNINFITVFCYNRYKSNLFIGYCYVCMNPCISFVYILLSKIDLSLSLATISFLFNRL